MAPSVGGASLPKLEPAWTDSWDPLWNDPTHPEKRRRGRGRRAFIGLAIAVLIIGLAILLVGHWHTAKPTMTPWDGYPSVVAGVDCPNASHCVITGAEGVAGNGGPGLVMVTTDGGKAWRLGRLPTMLDDSTITSVSCPTASACTAVGSANDLLASDDGGLTWTLRPHFAVAGQRSSSSVSAIECVTANRCLALTSADTVASTTDSGGTWHLIANVFAHPFPMTAAAFDCASPSTCVIVGTNTGPHLTAVADALATSDGGLTWNKILLPQGLPGNPDDVSCPTAQQCFVVTDNLSPVVVSMVSSEGNWSVSELGDVDASLKPPVDGPGSSKNSIDCASATQCVVVGGEDSLSSQAPPAVNLTEDAGIVWRPLELGALTPVGPVCPSHSFCIALDDTDNVVNSENNPTGLSNVVLVSTNGEESWTVIRPHSVSRPH